MDGVERTMLAKKERVKAIPEQMESLNSAMDRLDNLIHELEEKLIPIAFPTPVDAEIDQPMESMVDLAEAIRNRRDRLESVCDRLLRLIKAIEL